MSWRRGAFLAAVLTTLGLAGFFAGMVALLNLMPGSVGMAHFAEEHHRVHDVTLALLNAVTVVGMLAQLRAPLGHGAAQIMALVPFGALLLATAATNASVLSPPWLLVGASAVVAMMFHPIGDPLRAFRGSRPDPVLMALVGAAALPLVAYAWTNIGLQRAGPSEHAIMGHYGFMAALCFTVILTALLASARPDGSQLIAWVAAALAVALGLVSLAYPAADSSLQTPWAAAAIVWGIAFALSDRIRARSRSTYSGARP